MTSRFALARVIILVSFAIMTLIIYSLRLTNRHVYDPDDPVFKEYIFLRHEHSNHQLLLHSINIGTDSIKAYSSSADSVMRFVVNSENIASIKDIIRNFNYSFQKCLKCHQKY